MGLFSFLKKKHTTAPAPAENSTTNEPNYIENPYSPVEDNETKEEEKTLNPFKKLEKKRKQKEKETLIINSLKPYRCSQKIIIWNNGEQETIYGYPVALIPTESGYVILYRKRAVDFLEELIIKLKSIFFGYKEQYRILHVPEYCLSKSQDILTVYAHSFRVINPLTEEAIPIEDNDPRKRIFWNIEKTKAEAYRRALHKVLHEELPIIIERALALNPTLRAYQGREGLKGRKESKIKEFSGVEVGFSIFDELERQLRKEAGLDE